MGKHSRSRSRRSRSNSHHKKIKHRHSRSSSRHKNRKVEKYNKYRKEEKEKIYKKDDKKYKEKRNDREKKYFFKIELGQKKGGQIKEIEKTKRVKGLTLLISGKNSSQESLTNEKENKQKIKDLKQIIEQKQDNPVNNAEDLENLDIDEQMAKIMGFTNFDTTKNKSHQEAAVEGVSKGIKLKRKYRQYMCRRGGFNKILDSV